MKFQIGGRKISIQVEEPLPGLTCAEDTLYFMNELSLAYSREAEYLKILGDPRLAERSDQKSWEIFNELKKRGFYDDEGKEAV